MHFPHHIKIFMYTPVIFSLILFFKKLKIFFKKNKLQTITFTLAQIPEYQVRPTIHFVILIIQLFSGLVTFAQPPSIRVHYSNQENTH